MVRIERKALGVAAEPVHGIPIAISRTLCLLRVVVDHSPDGYGILRIADVTAIRSNRFERFDETVLRGEGQLPKAWPPRHLVPVDDWATALNALRLRSGFATIEVERRRSPEFHLGRIVSTHSLEGDVWLHYVKADGSWERWPIAIALKDITWVRYGDYYTRMVRRYANKQPAI